MALFRKDVLSFIDEKKETSLKEHTILLVDDEEHNLITLSDLLRDQYDVLTATSGSDALNVIEKYEQKEKIHLIISDQRMPNMLGVDFLERTRTVLPNTIRVILTGFSDTDVLIASINHAEIYRFVLKPYNQEDLLLTIRRALEAYTLENRNLLLVEELQRLNAQLEDKVKERTETLEKTLAELKEINHTKDRFFSIIAHDTSNILQTLFLSGEMLTNASKFSDAETTRQLAEKMFVSSKRLGRLMENLTQWAKLQMGNMEPKPGMYDLNPLVKEVLELLSESAAHKKISLLNDISEHTKVYIDYNMVNLVIRNLVTNAIKFTHLEGEIRISTAEIKDFAKVIITDNGVGIPQEKIADLFQVDRNFTTPGTAEEPGSGLGLILCKEMVEKNQGKIWVESELDQGSSFMFTLPKSNQSVSQET